MEEIHSDIVAGAGNMVIERAVIDLSRYSGLETVLHHIRRYQFASEFVRDTDDVLDLCSGTGYGAYILSQKARSVTAIEKDLGAVEYAKQHYGHGRCQYLCADVTDYQFTECDIVTMFECLDHIEKKAGRELIKRIGKLCRRLLFASLPEDQKIGVNPYHLAQWTIQELKKELEKHFTRVVIFGQAWNSGVISFPYDERRAISIVVAIKDADYTR